MNHALNYLYCNARGGKLKKEVQGGGELKIEMEKGENVGIKCLEILYFWVIYKIHSTYPCLGLLVQKETRCS